MSLTGNIEKAEIDQLRATPYPGPNGESGYTMLDVLHAVLASSAGLSLNLLMDGKSGRFPGTRLQHVPHFNRSLLEPLTANQAIRIKEEVWQLHYLLCGGDGDPGLEKREDARMALSRCYHIFSESDPSGQHIHGAIKKTMELLKLGEIEPWTPPIDTPLFPESIRLR